MMTVGDLIESFHIYAVCTGCERMEQVAIEPLVAAHGADLSIERLRCRLRCRQCRRRTGDMRIVYVGKQATLSGFHYRGNPPHAPRPDTRPAGARRPSGPTGAAES